MIRPADRAMRIIFRVVLLCAVAFAIARWVSVAWFGRAALERALTGRGTVAVVGTGFSAGFSPEGVQLRSAPDVAGLRAALDGNDPAVLITAMDAGGIDALLVAAGAQGGGSVLAQLASYRS